MRPIWIVFGNFHCFFLLKWVSFDCQTDKSENRMKPSVKLSMFPAHPVLAASAPSMQAQLIATGQITDVRPFGTFLNFVGNISTSFSS